MCYCCIDGESLSIQLEIVELFDNSLRDVVKLVAMMAFVFLPFHCCDFLLLVCVLYEKWLSVRDNDDHDDYTIMKMKCKFSFFILQKNIFYQSLLTCSFSTSRFSVFFLVIHSNKEKRMNWKEMTSTEEQFVLWPLHWLLQDERVSLHDDPGSVVLFHCVFLHFVHFHSMKIRFLVLFAFVISLLILLLVSVEPEDPNPKVIFWVVA